MATLYPPTLAASQPAFVSASLYTIKFTMPELVSLSDIGHVQIKIVKQSNGASIVDTTKYPDGIIYKKNTDVNFTDGEVTILNSDLAEPKWQQDTYYKVQMRFGADSELSWLDEKNRKDFYNWKTTQITNNTTTYQTFGEWSTIMVLKCISQPLIALSSEQLSDSSSNVQFDSTLHAVDTITPLFSGRYGCISNEPVDKYRFRVYKGQSTDEADLFLDTGWLQHNVTQDNVSLDKNWLQENQIEDLISKTPAVLSSDKHRFKQTLSENEQYTLIYSVITKNGYEGSSNPSYFEVIPSRLNQLAGITLEVYDHTNALTNEEGCMVLAIDFKDSISGNFVIIRTDEYSDYNFWEDLCYFTVVGTKDILYKTDYTIESGIKYKYAIVKENSSGYRSIPLMEKDAPARWVDFQYNYILGTKGHIRLMYDNTIQSFKKNVLQNKQDTIGGKYPVVTKNGYAYYSEFQVEGLISVEQEVAEYVDSDSFRFKSGDYLAGADKICFSVNSKDNYWRRADNFEDFDRTEDEDGNIKEWLGGIYVCDVNNLDNNNDLTDDYYFVERKYRELLIDFLNDGEYKLYKSPTEGNILVVLTEVSLTPKEELGRLIYSFSATAIEVDEPSLENLDEFDLIDIGEFQEQVGDTETICGQVSGLFTETDDIMQAIVENCHQRIGDSDYEYQFRNLKAISIDVYPNQNFDVQISIIDTEIARKKTSLELETIEYKVLRLKNEIAELQKQRTTLEMLQEAISKNTYYSSIKLTIDGNEIRIKPNRTYNFDNFAMTSGHQIFTLPFEATDKDGIKQKYYTPITVNYTARVITTEALSRTVVSKDMLTIWGQLGGAFETDKKILNNYNDKRIKTEYRVYNEADPNAVDSTYDAQHQMNYIVIQTDDILEAIKQMCRKQTENTYKTSFSNYDETDDTYNDGTRYYAFEHISKLDIEADEGTIIYIKSKYDKTDRAIRIGATERYVLNNLSDGDIVSLKFADNTKNYALINYTCKVSVLTMGAAANAG